MKNEMLEANKKPIKFKVNEYLVQFELIIPNYRGTIYTDYLTFQYVDRFTAKQIFDSVVETLIANWSKQLNTELQVKHFKFNIFSLVNSYESFL